MSKDRGIWNLESAGTSRVGSSKYIPQSRARSIRGKKGQNGELTKNGDDSLGRNYDNHKRSLEEAESCDGRRKNISARGFDSAHQISYLEKKGTRPS